jgi:hypothetical protein
MADRKIEAKENKISNYSNLLGDYPFKERDFPFLPFYKGATQTGHGSYSNTIP